MKTDNETTDIVLFRQKPGDLIRGQALISAELRLIRGPALISKTYGTTYAVPQRSPYSGPNPVWTEYSHSYVSIEFK